MYEETGEVKVEHDYLNELQISEAKEINSDYQVGDEILVKSMGYDKKGRLNLSRKEVLKGSEEKKEETK